MGNHEIILSDVVSMDKIIWFVDDYICLLEIESQKLSVDEMQQYNNHNNV